MASVTLTDAKLVVNGVDLSAFVRAIAITFEANQNDATVMGDTTIANLPGLKNWSIEATLKQDFAASGPDVTLFPLVGNTGFSIEVKPVNSLTTSATNPVFRSSSAVLASYPPLGGSVGDLAETAVTFQPGEGGPLLRTT